MREIKFKGIRVDNGEWVEGYFFIDLENKKPYVMLIKRKETAKDWMVKSLEVVQETVCQFTGLKDKNGIEIYEGDICNNCNETGVITWLDNYASYGLREYKDGQIISDRYPLFRYYELEVIGNIHDKIKEQ